MGSVGMSDHTTVHHFCWENCVSKIPFSNPRIDRIVNVKNSNLDLIQRIYSSCGFDGFMIRFRICLRNAPSVTLLAKYVIEDLYKTRTPDTPLDLNHGPLGKPGPSTTHVDDP